MPTDFSATFTVTTSILEDGITPHQLARHAWDANGRLNVEVPLRNIGFTQDPWDIAADYVDALYFGERLFPLTYSSSAHRQFEYNSSSILFRLHLTDIPAACQLIYRLLDAIFGEGDDEEIREEIVDLEEQLYWQSPKQILHFPELADDYLANLLHASFPWEDPENKREYERRFPETRLRFWRSFLSPIIGHDLLVSTRSWAAPLEVDLSALLIRDEFLGSYENIAFSPARLVRVSGREPLLIGSNHASVFALDAIRTANKLTSSLRPFGPGSANAIDCEWLLSPAGVVVHQSRFGQHVTFCEPAGVNMNQTQRWLESVDELAHDLRRAMGGIIHTPCDWTKLDDSSFEELCYDIVRRLPLFDESSVRKMGKSRSRDGGRDITAVSRAGPGREPALWIIQCKLLTSGRSLAGSAINMSDTVDQYGAKGYMVMTTAPIDATLYDKLDQIGKNRGFQFRTWSGLELERHLQGHRDLLSRYF